MTSKWEKDLISNERPLAIQPRSSREKVAEVDLVGDGAQTLF